MGPPLGQANGTNASLKRNELPQTRTPTQTHSSPRPHAMARAAPPPPGNDQHHRPILGWLVAATASSLPAHRPTSPSLPPHSVASITTPLPPAPPLTYRHVRGAQVLDRALEELVHKELAQVLHAGRGRGGGRRLLHLMMMMMLVGRRRL